MVIRKLPRLTVDGLKMRFRIDFDLWCFEAIGYWLFFLHALRYSIRLDMVIFFAFPTHNHTLYKYRTINERERSGKECIAS